MVKSALICTDKSKLDYTPRVKDQNLSFCTILQDVCPTALSPSANHNSVIISSLRLKV